MHLHIQAASLEILRSDVLCTMVIKHVAVETLGGPPAPLDFARPVANHLRRETSGCEGSSTAALAFLRVTPSTSVTASRAEGAGGVTVWIWVPLVTPCGFFWQYVKPLCNTCDAIPLVSETMQNATLILNRLQRQALTFSGNPTLGLRASIRQTPPPVQNHPQTRHRTTDPKHLPLLSDYLD